MSTTTTTTANNRERKVKGKRQGNARIGGAVATKSNAAATTSDPSPLRSTSAAATETTKAQGWSAMQRPRATTEEEEEQHAFTYTTQQEQSDEGQHPYLVKGIKVPCVYYDPVFLNKEEANSYHEVLSQALEWRINTQTNRHTVLYGDKGVEYFYKDQPSLEVQDWLPELLDIKLRVEGWYKEQTGKEVRFNVCLCNFYEDGKQSIGWHSDREEIGKTTPIASVSLGAERLFYFRSKTDDTDATKVRLANGSLLVMENECQSLYLHTLPRDKSIKTSRVNLTFRVKY
ncbi:Alpha-ketoglutarate-dependent dioxygenase AlkB [Balamuthia mandrillaris]